MAARLSDTGKLLPPEMLASIAAGAEQLSRELDGLTERMLERLWADAELAAFTEPDNREPARQIARASLANEVAMLRRGCELPVSCPPEDAAAARAAVEFDAPVTVVLKSYRAGHAALQEAWLDAVEQIEPNPARRRALIDAGTEFMFAYADRCSTWVEREYTRERDRTLRVREQHRTRLVRDVLSGGSAAEAESLGYELDAEHLGFVAWGPEADAALSELAAELGRALLSLAKDGQVWWGWLGGAAALHAPEHRRLRSYRPAEGTAIAVGGPGRGIEGFRRAHVEAGHAHRVAKRRLSSVTFYEDVALEALAGQDEVAARAFVARELGELARDDRRSRAFRETLSAYFAAGQNASSAAGLLGVHERTVANRVRAVEERLKCSVAGRRAELETALRLRDWLEP